MNHPPIIILIWLVVSTPLKNISQLGWLFPIYGKIKDCSKAPTSYRWYVYHSQSCVVYGCLWLRFATMNLNPQVNGLVLKRENRNRKPSLFCHSIWGFPVSIFRWKPICWHIWFSHGFPMVFVWFSYGFPMHWSRRTTWFLVPRTHLHHFTGKGLWLLWCAGILVWSQMGKGVY